MTTRMTLHQVSQLLTASVSLSLQEIEKYLNHEGFTLGYRPLTKGKMTLLSVLNRRIPNQAAFKYGEIDDICVAVKIKKGSTIFSTKLTPRSATGPEFKRVFIGSHSQFGKFIEATLKIWPLPEEVKKLNLVWKKATDQENFLKLFWSSGIRPSLFQVSKNKLQLEIEGDAEMIQIEVGCIEQYVDQTKGSIV